MIFKEELAEGRASDDRRRWCIANRLKRDEVMQVSGLIGCESLLCQRKQLVVNTFVNFGPNFRTGETRQDVETAFYFYPLFC